ncbi:putative indole-3-pyruvate monooxygenase YUCCA8 [Leucoagaricus sp. SymC.cos]|nr:putative indole-3-pyruvate monooxygenase YUCCA8 [Leucoagaricus sp. SymC.cos]
MSDRVPTLQKLNATLPKDLDVNNIAHEWFTSFVGHLESRSFEALVSDILLPDALWRDILALTWEFRTFNGQQRILKFLEDQVPSFGISRLQLTEVVGLQRPYPDIAWVVALFSFETKVGTASGVFRLTPTSSGTWKAHSIFTNLEDLKGFQEKIGTHRNTDVCHVLIIGAGHSGLELAARLRYLNVDALVVDRNARIGDNWRSRYDALCLHWPVWFDHMAYLPFPPTWPKYTPSRKMADWLVLYAAALDLNVWTGTNVIHAQEPANGNDKWEVTIEQSDSSRRTFAVSHLVFATGTGDGSPNIPSIKGEVIHSSQYKTYEAYQGRKVAVVGAGVSAHDICADLAKHGIDVTMIQRGPTFVMNLDKNWNYVGGPLYSEGSPPTDIADRLAASMPQLLLENGMAQRQTRAIVESDKDLLDGLRNAGFKVYHGIKDTGFLLLLKGKGGGHYFNVGASDLIIEGKIKLKNDSEISSLCASSLNFEDGSSLSTDVVVFATGAGDLRSPIYSICGRDVGNRCKPIWGLDGEGEIQGCWRDLGVPRLWYMTGSFQMARFHSKHLALRKWSISLVRDLVVNLPRNQGDGGRCSCRDIQIIESLRTREPVALRIPSSWS